MQTHRWIPVALGLVAILVLLIGTALMPRGVLMPLMPMPMQGMMYGWTGGAWGWVASLLSVLMLVVFGLVIAGPVLIVLWVARAVGAGTGIQSVQDTPRETPLDILKARYARGEITQEQFEQMRQMLTV